VLGEVAIAGAAETGRHGGGKNGN